MNDVHDARRKQLEQAVVAASMALFEHVGVAAAFMLPIDKASGLYVAAGPLEDVRALVGTTPLP
jgi:hypothetical protein